jgi:hypothetical protein
MSSQWQTADASFMPSKFKTMPRSVVNLKSIIALILFVAIPMMGAAQQMPPVPLNQLVLPEGDHTIKLVWGGDTLNSKWDPYAALLIPVKLEGCPDQFYMQFDLGSPYTMLYLDKLKDISAQYPGMVTVTDSTKKLQDFHFSAGKTTIVAKEITLRSVNGRGLDHRKDAKNVIGTIGGDLIENKVVVLDYPGKTLFLSSDIPDRLKSNIQMTDFMLAGRAVLLPAIIRGKKTMLYFDTGSSTFELITDEATALSMSTANAIPAKYAVNSWGNKMTANTLPSGDSITIASQKLPLHHVTYFEGFSESTVNKFMKMGMGGMTGNRLFLQSILILDTKNKKFGVVNKK